MTLYYLTPISAIFQYFNDVGVVLAGGKVYTYLAGTTTPTATYTDVTGGTPNANPLTLASNGRLNNVQIWQPGGSLIKLVIKDASGNQLGPVFDQISGINDPATTLASLASPNTGFGVDLVANANRSYGLFSDMRAANVPSLAVGQTLVVFVQGGTTLVDGNGGAFRWSATSSASDDGFNVIKPTAAGGTGRYVRIETPNSNGTFFTATLGGVNATVTTPMFYTVYNFTSATLARQMVSLYGAGTFTGTSNTSTLFITGLPVAIQPQSERHVACTDIVDNSTINGGEAIIYAAGSGSAGTLGISLAVVSGARLSYNLNGFVGSGTKGFNTGWSITYNL